MKIAEIDTLSKRYGCSNENYFSVLVAQSIVTIQHQVCEENHATRTSFSLACWQPPSTKKNLLILVTLKAQLLVIAQLCCTLWSNKRCPEECLVLYVELVALLNWLQRHVCGGICIPQVHADVGKVRWSKYSMKIILYNYSTNQWVLFRNAKYMIYPKWFRCLTSSSVAQMDIQILVLNI